MARGGGARNIRHGRTGEQRRNSTYESVPCSTGESSCPMIDETEQDTGAAEYSFAQDPKDAERGNEVQDRCQESLKEHLDNLRWLPLWARPRLLMKIAWDFAKMNKNLPLGITAGQVIPLVIALTITRWGFNCAVMMLLSLQTADCSHYGIAEYSYVVWIVWLPVQLLYLMVEANVFRYIAIPKVQVLGKGKLCWWWHGDPPPFSVWFAWQLFLSTLCSLDTTCDSLFFGTQSNQRHCEMGTIVEHRWASIFRPSFGSLVIPYYMWCWVGWLFTFVPVIYIVFLNFVSASSWRRIIYGESMDDNDLLSVDYEVNFEAHPDHPRGKECEGFFVHFEDHRISEKLRPWHLDGRNHGEVIMAFAEISGLHSIVYEDLQFATLKANGILQRMKEHERRISEVVEEAGKIDVDEIKKIKADHGEDFPQEAEEWIENQAERDDIPEKLRKSMKTNNEDQRHAAILKIKGECEKESKLPSLETACNHVSSQVQRVVAHTVLSGALVNGYQLLLQTTALTIAVNSSPLDYRIVQPLSSILFSLVSLSLRLSGACNTIYNGWTLVGSLKQELPPKEEKSQSIKGKIDQINLWLSGLVAGSVTCFLLILWSCSKIIAMFRCPHSVWAPFDGCWIPDAEYLRFCAKLAKTGNQTFPC